MVELRDIKSLSHSELESYIAELGLPMFRVKQIEEWLYIHHCSSFDDMTNLPKKIRDQLKCNFSLYIPHVISKQISSDGTRKYLLMLNDETMVETVGIPSHNNSKLTVCFSTQAGCPIGCVFCATGQSGFRRNLTPGEILDQIYLVSEDFDARVTNTVGMGQGEPFLNYDNVLATLRRINNAIGLGIGARHITVSTCGIIDKIRNFSFEPEQFTLAISLHSAVQSTRDYIMPSMAHSPLDKLRDALVFYSTHTNRRPTLEYALIKDINDDEKHLNRLIEFCTGLLCHVNLIPLNPISKTSLNKSFLFEPSSKLADFATALSDANIECTVRKSRGKDIDGACGQLHQRHSNT